MAVVCQGLACLYSLKLVFCQQITAHFVNLSIKIPKLPILYTNITIRISRYYKYINIIIVYRSVPTTFHLRFSFPSFYFLQLASTSPFPYIFCSAAYYDYDSF